MVTTNGLLTIDDISLCNDEFVLSMHTGKNKLDIMAKSQMETLLNWTYEKEQRDGATVGIHDFTVAECTAWMR